MIIDAKIVIESLPVVSIAADVPLVFPTVQLYVPKASVTLWSMMSTVSYVPVAALVTTCACWYVELIVITAPSFLQVTVVAGPPVEVQVRDLVVSLYTSVVAVGVPETKINVMQEIKVDLFADVTQSFRHIYRRGQKMRRNDL